VSQNLMADPLIAAVIFALGLAFGSFLNVCIYRLPLGLSTVHPGSACPNCKRGIRFYDNVPILSWLLLRARCRNCKLPISPRYLIVELLVGALFLLCYLHFGYTLSALKYCCFGFLLLGLIFTDAETHLLPDKMTLTGVALGLVFSLLVPVNDLVSQFLPSAEFMQSHSGLASQLLSFLDSLVGAFVGASFIYGAGAIYLRARGVEGMGFGDVKLMAMVGAFLGLRLTIFTIFAGSIAGSIVGVWTVLSVWIKRTRRYSAHGNTPSSQARKRAWESATVALRGYQMPFGVFLGTMALAAAFFGDQFLRWYWRLL
jgi:leader peptidase (prepilin peptidase) / N-methyltransferase